MNRQEETAFEELILGFLEDNRGKSAAYLAHEISELILMDYFVQPKPDYQELPKVDRTMSEALESTTGGIESLVSALNRWVMGK